MTQTMTNDYPTPSPTAPPPLPWGGTGSTRSAWTSLSRNPLRYLTSAAPWRALVHLAISIVFGWLCFGLYVVIILLPFAPAWSYLLAKVERQRIVLLGVPPIVNPHAPLRDRSVTSRIGDRLGESATWRETGYSLILAAAAPFLSIGLMIAGAFVGACLLAPWLITMEPVLMFGGWVIDSQPEAWALTALGIPLAAILLYLCAGVAAALAALAQALLGPREEELAARLADMSASRGILVTSFEGERRRIERDLHDGPQRDLVALSMHLGELQLAVDDETVDADALRRHMSEAQDRVEQVLASLRDTVRGVHPQVLDDHGVTAACIELGRGPLPVRVVCDGAWYNGRRLPAEIEKAMYYTASEAVTNAAKHGRATMVTITLGEGNGTITMEVVDDGTGGADPTRGTGLSGLVERAAAVGADLDIVSPQGGPTRLVWTLRS